MTGFTRFTGESVMASVTVTSLLFALVGLLFVCLSIPLIRNRVPPNRYYGFRTPKTLSDAKIWYEVNHISGVDLFVAGAVITLSSLVMFAVGQAWRPEHVALTLVSIMVFSLIGVTWHGFIVLRRIAK
jgi:uncharacterized membrane protein